MVLLTLLASALFGTYELRSSYRVEHDTVKSTTLFPTLDKEFELFSIPPSKTKKRISSSEIVNAFARHGITVKNARTRYIDFLRDSPIDVAPLEAFIAQKYLARYPTLQIKKITVTPRVYTPKLPADYTAVLSSKTFRSDEGTFYVQSPQSAKLFFDYRIDAVVGVIHAKHTLGRKEELNALNTLMRELPFSSVKSHPLTSLEKPYRLKHKVKADSPISQRDVENTPLVKRGKNITVEIKSAGVLIQFSAIALQDGGLHDIISVQKPDGQRIKAKVTGLNRVEIQ